MESGVEGMLDISEGIDFVLDGNGYLMDISSTFESKADPKDGDTVKCSVIGGCPHDKKSRYVKQGDKSRVHFIPSNTDVPDEKGNDE